MDGLLTGGLTGQGGDGLLTAGLYELLSEVGEEPGPGETVYVPVAGGALRVRLEPQPALRVKLGGSE